jgi:gluconolactonase
MALRPTALFSIEHESSLFVAMTRDNAVWHIPFFQDGSVQRMGRFSSDYGIGGPDGMALDEEGNLFVAHSTLGTVFIHRPNGELMGKIKSPMGQGTTNLTWAGESFKTLYITESETGTILTVDWYCAGCL